MRMHLPTMIPRPPCVAAAMHACWMFAIAFAVRPTTLFHVLVPTMQSRSLCNHDSNSNKHADIPTAFKYKTFSTSPYTRDAIMYLDKGYTARHSTVAVQRCDQSRGSPRTPTPELPHCEAANCMRRLCADADFMKENARYDEWYRIKI